MLIYIFKSKKKMIVMLNTYPGLKVKSEWLTLTSKT